MYDALAEPHRTSTTDRVAESLRAALLAGELAPGTPLREVALAERLGVARSTVREALRLLVADGLAVRAPNRGVTVTAMTAEDLADVSRARAVLELAGVRAWPQADPASRAAVGDALDAYARAARRPEALALTEAHLGVHRAIAGLVGSARLGALADSLTDELRLALATVDRRRRNARQQVREHRELIDLLVAGRTEDAATALSAHLRAAERSLAEAVAPPG